MPLSLCHTLWGHRRHLSSLFISLSPCRPGGGGIPSDGGGTRPALLLGARGQGRRGASTASTLPVEPAHTFSGRSLCPPLCTLPLAYRRRNYTQMGPNAFGRDSYPIL